MMCDDARLLVHAYLDDELDAANSAAVARHLHKALAQPSLYRRAPAELRQRWLQATASTVAPAPRRPRRTPIAFALAAGFVAALLLMSPLLFHTWQQPVWSDDQIVTQAISGHIRSLQEQHLMDVVSTDQHTVKPWFEGKLDFSPRVKDLADEGFALVGGRLDAMDGHAVAALIYKRRLHVINLYQWPMDTTTATSQEQTQRHGYTVIRWTADGMRFVAISDVNESDLKQFVLAFQNQAGAPGTH
jgi:anti-sigma factor RsiW